ncbi:hypothetical protein [Bacillus altitudinis]|uniref:hypothetical protein n=1 Tax=Bacillus altitudinis TaxID=293387 RepID=UPI00197FE042|nr:hypothetical protein [Bacillus altitudinis]
MMRHRTILFITIFIVLLITFILFVRQGKVSGDIDYNDEMLDVTGPGTETVSYGMYEPEGKLLDTLDIGLIKNNQINKVLSFSHYIDAARKYTLFLLANFNQIAFSADHHRPAKSYTFEMTKDQVMTLPIKATLPKDVGEIAFIIVPEAKYHLKDSHIDIATGLQENYIMRFITKKASSHHIRSEFSPIYKTDELTGEEIFMASGKVSNKVLYTSKSQMPVYLQVDNTGKEKMNYALVAFSEFDQQKFNGNHVIYVTVESGKTNVYQIKLPKVKKEKNFQVIAFPAPFDNSTKFEDVNFRGYSSIRTLIQP